MEDLAARTAIAALKEAMVRHDRIAINAACRALVEGRPRLGRQWQAIATVLQHHGEHLLAIGAVSAWVEQSEGALEAAFAQTAVLARAGRLHEADAVLGALPPDYPSACAYAFTRGTIAANLGDRDEAARWLRAAVAADPGSGQAWLALAMSARVAPRDLAALRRAGETMASAPPVERAAWHYALGKAMLDEGDADGAVAALGEGAATMRRQQPFDLAADRADAGAARAGWTASAIEGWRPPHDAAATRAIFVTGLPRSGTTLVEQILSSHSAVTGGDELGLMRLIEQDIGGKTAADLSRHLDRGGRLDGLRDLYAHLLTERFGPHGRVVDKTLSASRYIGLITTLFPAAPILWVRRAPLDCAWSAYRTWFVQGVTWSWSLEDIAHHFAIEDALLAHWQAILPGRILTTEYERLVRNPKPEIARITAFCGLSLEAAQLSPHLGERVVTTASAAQVRDPIHARSVGEGERHRRFLAAFERAYRPGA